MWTIIILMIAMIGDDCWLMHHRRWFPIWMMNRDIIFYIFLQSCTRKLFRQNYSAHSTLKLWKCTLFPHIFVWWSYSQIPIKWNSIFKVWLRKSLNFFPFYRISISEAQTKKVSQRLSIFDLVSCLMHSMFP